MSLSPRARMLVGFVLANTFLLMVATTLWLNRSTNPPLIQGVFLAQSRALPDFSLLDHHGRAFSRSELVGRWHLISYGFTTCPDICPTTLAQVAAMADKLEDNNEADDLEVIFYSVDHRRDTVAQLASYVPFFHPDFVGLTHVDNPENPHLPFEQSLGIVAQLIPIIEEGAEPDPNAYEVVHVLEVLPS